MLSIVATLMGSKIGRYAAAVLLGMAAIGLAVLRIFSNGRAYERAKDNETKLIHAGNAIRAGEEVSKLSRADRLEYLNGWVRDE